VVYDKVQMKLELKCLCSKYQMLKRSTVLNDRLIMSAIFTFNDVTCF